MRRKRPRQQSNLLRSLPRRRHEAENIDRAVGIGRTNVATIGGEGDIVDWSWELPLLERFTR